MLYSPGSCHLSLHLICSFHSAVHGISYDSSHLMAWQLSLECNWKHLNEWVKLHFNAQTPNICAYGGLRLYAPVKQIKHRKIKGCPWLTIFCYRRVWKIQVVFWPQSPVHVSTKHYYSRCCGSETVTVALLFLVLLAHTGMCWKQLMAAAHTHSAALRV